MAFYSVERRLTAKGEPRYRVTVAVKKDGEYIHREYQTFPRLPMARAWGAQRVSEIEAGGLIRKEPEAALKGLILRYLADENMRKSKGKATVLIKIAESSLGETRLSELKMNRYIEHARVRRAYISASTLAGELSYLKTVLDIAQPFYGLEVPIQEFNAARIYLSRMSITGVSNKRTRRPTRQEFNALYAELELAFKRSHLGIRYHDVFEFAVYSCMRRSEICGIKWEDVDFKNKSVIIRNRKDPRKKLGNHMVVPLLGKAWDILVAQDCTGDRVFPYLPMTITLRFNKARKKLNIPDIRFHDMRREAASRLFELGFSVEEVAQVTGHKNLKTLWTVYREIYPESLHNRFDELTASRTKS